MKKMSVDEALQAALDSLNGGDPIKAYDLALQVLQAQPQNRDAFMILGAARFAILCHPHDVFFAKLAALGYRPRAAVDIGAYEGQWTAALKRSFPDTPVLMIEAQPEKAPVLEELASTLAGVSHRTCLVGERTDAAVTFHVMDTPYGSTGSSMYPEQTSFSRDAVSLRMDTLDNILADAGLADPDLLKIDVQGAELDVLRGAATSLKSVELIHMELSTLQYNEGAPLAAEVVAFMDEAGFVLFDILEEHRITGNVLSQLDALFVRKGSALRPAGTLF